MVPGVIYGGGAAPQTINVKFNTLLKQLKAGKFLSTLLNVQVDGQDNVVICRAVQRDVVKDLPTHVDFLRLGERSASACISRSNSSTPTNPRASSAAAC